jgi:ankyrin repeat protein
MSLLLDYCIFGPKTQVESEPAYLDSIIHQANTSFSKSGSSALHLAIIGVQSSEVLQTLIEADANVNCQNLYGETPLHWASQVGDCSVINLLLDTGASPLIHFFTIILISV